MTLHPVPIPFKRKMPRTAFCSRAGVTPALSGLLQRKSIALPFGNTQGRLWFLRLRSGRRMGARGGRQNPHLPRSTMTAAPRLCSDTRRRCYQCFCRHSQTDSVPPISAGVVTPQRGPLAPKMEAGLGVVGGIGASGVNTEVPGIAACDAVSSHPMGR